MNKKFEIVKFGRGQYQVIDELGNTFPAFPTSQHNCRMFILEYKTDKKFLADVKMQKVAMKHINDRGLKQHEFGTLDQFMANSIYKMYYKDVLRLMRSQNNYRQHLLELDERNRKARQNNQ